MSNRDVDDLHSLVLPTQPGLHPGGKLILRQHDPVAPLQREALCHEVECASGGAADKVDGMRGHVHEIREPRDFAAVTFAAPLERAPHAFGLAGVVELGSGSPVSGLVHDSPAAAVRSDRHSVQDAGKAARTSFVSSIYTSTDLPEAEPRAVPSNSMQTAAQFLFVVGPAGLPRRINNARPASRWPKIARKIPVWPLKLALKNTARRSRVRPAQASTTLA